ncbi:MAG: phytoene desaturase family protein [Bacteroidales bacterium]
MPPKVNIIGAGIAGLSAGCYLQMNGFDTEIFEMHDLPGGLCTSWKRNDYTIDGCLHWVVGSSSSDPIYKLWNELIDMKNMQFVDSDVYFRVEDETGRVIIAYTDLSKLEKELLEKAPEDKDHILDFIHAIRKLDNLQMPGEKPRELMNFWESLKMMRTFLPYLGVFNKWNKITAGEYAERCRNPLLKKLFELAFLPEMSMLFILFTFLWMNRKSAGYPVGGSLYFSRQIEKRYLELGGKINYGQKIDHIITGTRKDKMYASGVLTISGDIKSSDYVISAADAHSTIYNLLEGKFVDEKLKYYFRKFGVFPSLVQVSLGVNRNLSDFPRNVTFPLDEPLIVDPSVSAEYLGYFIHSQDPTLAPEGKTLITVMLDTYHYEYWENLRGKEFKKYLQEKKRIADSVIDALDKKLGGIREYTEMVDVSTPATIIRYTNNWKGSFEGWLLTKDTGLKSMRKTLPGLHNFYLCGHWVEPGGGVPSALMSGRNIAQIICRKEMKRFTTQSF